MKAQRPNYTSEKAERLETRLSKAQKALIQHAADLCGRSLTDFVLSASQEAANKIIQDHELITLTAKESKNFADALINPSPINSALAKAANRYRDFFKKND